jgi:hypothetical protein
MQDLTSQHVQQRPIDAPVRESDLIQVDEAKEIETLKNIGKSNKN